MEKKYACPCCGYRTLEEEGMYLICPVCFWEDDPSQSGRPDFDGGPNRVSLREAQKNFREFGACEKEMVKNVRKPTKKDIKDPDWKPLE